MEQFDWFGPVFGLLGLLSLLSGCYEWTWFWRLARPGYFPDMIGWKNTRRQYIVGGAGCLGAGIAFTMQSIFSAKSDWFFLLGFVLAMVLSVVLYNARGNQDIRELVPFIGNKNSKNEIQNENN